MKLFRGWLTEQIGGETAVDALIEAMLAGNEAAFAAHLGTLAESILSFHDPGGAQPERIYHAFVLGLLARLEGRFDVRSNRESGYGRADVLVLPKSPGQTGVVLELKQLEHGTSPSVEAALEAAFSQIRDKDYAAELRAREAEPIHVFAVVFDGKRVHIAKGAESYSQT